MPPIRMICLIMRAPFRFIAVPCGLLVLSAFVANLPAQQPTGKTAPRASQPQPAAAKTGQVPKTGPITQTGGQANIGAKADVSKLPRADGSTPNIERMDAEEPVSAELQKILDEWEKKSALIKSLHGRHTRVVYNLVFEVEKLSEGKFYVETPDKGRIDLVGLSPQKGEVSKRLGKKGEPFQLVADRAEKWICDGIEIKMVNDAEKSYEVEDLPRHLRGTNIINGPLPFLFGMKAAEIKRRYHIELIPTKNIEVHTLRVVPRRLNDRDNYREAFVRLEKARFLPTAVKLVDPTGNLETVYTFTIARDGVNNVNNSNFISKMKELFGGEDNDPFHPNLKKYKRVLPPQTGDTTIVPASGTATRPGTTNTSRPGVNGQPLSNPQQATRPGTSSPGTSRK
ncbi:MAG: hypothetical protein AABP62_06680 [Planctomycetota bacterium]